MLKMETKHSISERLSDAENRNKTSANLDFMDAEKVCSS